MSVGGLVPERAGPPLVALAVQAHGRVLAEVEVLDAQVGGFLDAGAGVVEEQQQGAVAQREPAVGWAGRASRCWISSRSRNWSPAAARAWSGWRRPAGRRSSISGRAGRRCTRTGCGSRRAVGCGCGCGCRGPASRWRRNATIRSKVRSPSVRRVILRALVRRRGRRAAAGSCRGSCAPRTGRSPLTVIRWSSEERVQELARAALCGLIAPLSVHAGSANALEAAVGLVEQRRGDRQVDGGRGRVDVPHEG